MSLFTFPVPSVAAPLPHPVRQPCWVSHSLPDLLVFTCIISLASLECLSSPKSQAHCHLLGDLAWALLALSHTSIPILASWLEGTAPPCLVSGGPWKPLLVWNLCLLIFVVLTPTMAPDTEPMLRERIAETEQINKMNVSDTKLCVKSFAHRWRGKL